MLNPKTTLHWRGFDHGFRRNGCPVHLPEPESSTRQPTPPWTSMQEARLVGRPCFIPGKLLVLVHLLREVRKLDASDKVVLVSNYGFAARRSG